MNYPYPPRTKENTVECKVINMTPELASHYLSNNPTNRPVSRARIIQFAAMMANGQWALNGETVVISATGRLLDGQHRLAAVVEHGHAVPMLVATGALDSTFSTIDIGAKRSAADILSISGFRNVNILGAAAGTIYRLFHGLGGNVSVPPPSILAVAERYPSLSKWAGKTDSTNRIVSGAALTTALVYLDTFACRADLAEELYSGVKTGEDLRRGNPILAFRNRCINARAESGGTGVSQRYIWGTLIRTIDALEAGEQLVLVKSFDPTNTLRRPARFAWHTRNFTPEQRLADIPPNTSGGAAVELAAAE
jgi:hypothetical protein